MLLSGRAKYTYSNMQNALLLALNGHSLRIPSLSMITTSPGSTSRMNSAWIRSNAQLSDASTYAPSNFPRQSGRNPCGSRNPMISRSPMSTIENAPSIRRSAASPPPVPRGWASRCRTISLSTVVWKIDPRASSSVRSAAAFVRFPLWATASCPRAVSTTNGCAFFALLDPVVE